MMKETGLQRPCMHELDVILEFRNLRSIMKFIIELLKRVFKCTSSLFLFPNLTPELGFTLMMLQ